MSRVDSVRGYCMKCKGCYQEMYDQWICISCAKDKE